MFIRTADATYIPFYRDEDVEGTGGTTTTTTDTTAEAKGSEASTSELSPEIKALIQKSIDDATAGLKRKNEELIGVNKKIKADAEAIKANKTLLSDEEYAKYAALKEKIDQDEYLKLLTEGRAEEMVERVNKKARADFEAKLAAQGETTTKALAQAEEAQRRLEAVLVSTEITRAAVGAVKPQYADLVSKLVSDRVKLIDGAVRVVDADGAIETRVDGKTPLSISDLVETLRVDYADLFVTSQGGGASRSQGSQTSDRSNRLSLDAAAKLPMSEYARLRNEKKI